jgi:D-glycero-D-manno-heptose 1,7-bisphosphate phosphatase
VNPKAVFLDKDGTLIRDVPYNSDPDFIELLPGVEQGIKLLYLAGYRLVIVSNQSGIAHGFFSERDLRKVRWKMEELFESAGVPLEGFYYCPHHPEASRDEYRKACDCRKPACGLLLKAAEDLQLNISECWMVGDILDDVEAGRRAGCRTAFVDMGHETEWRISEFRLPEFVTRDFFEAAKRIVAHPPVEIAVMNESGRGFYEVE